MARPFRHTFILVLVALGTCVAALGGWRYARASAPVNGPIILISMEGIRADRLALYGSRGLRTPALDTLAADGVVFDRAYANVPQTLPSHASMLSGRLPFVTGVRDGVGFTVKPSERLLQEILRDRGFTTAGIVSSFLLRRETGLDQGFNVFDEAGAGRTALDSEKIAERWLGTAGSSRAFLFLHLADEDTADYDDRVAKADEAIGRLVRYLKTHQLYDRSTVIVTSDHGEGLGDHGETGHGLLLYEETLRLPLIVKQPAAEGSGRRVKEPVQLVDLAPTILEFAKAPVPGNLQGERLQPLLDGSTRGTPRIIYAESLFGAYHFGWAPLLTLFDGRYRYIKGAVEELYDVTAASRDTNLSEAKPDIVKTMRGELKKLAVPAPRVDAAVAPGDRRKLEAAGYVGLRVPGSAPLLIDETADPVTNVSFVERYRAAAAAAGAHEWTTAVEGYRGLVREQPGVPDLWLHLAETAAQAERHELAADAFRRVLDLDASARETAFAHLGAAASWLKLRRLDEARQHAAAVVDEGTAAAPAVAEAHELLARIALLRHEPERARAESALAEEADPRRPVRAYIEGRLEYEQGRYAAAAEAFDEALAAIDKQHGPLPAELRLWAADAFIKVDRLPQAEFLLMQELEEAPQNARARAALSAVYRATGRPDDAAALAQH